MTDWVAWHAAYADPHSPLSRRVAVVQRRLAELVAGRSGVTVLSLCAGDGRDVIDVCRGSGRRIERAVLIERDPELARRARAASDDVDQVEVRCADAADPRTSADVAPVDVLLLCGVLGNVTPDAVASSIVRIANLVADGGHVVWTRGGGAPDRRDDVRGLFVANGFDEVSFDGAPEPFGVGVSRLSAPPTGAEPSEPLFRFVR